MYPVRAVYLHYAFDLIDDDHSHALKSSPSTSVSFPVAIRVSGYCLSVRCAVLHIQRLHTYLTPLLTFHFLVSSTSLAVLSYKFLVIKIECKIHPPLSKILSPSSLSYSLLASFSFMFVFQLSDSKTESVTSQNETPPVSRQRNCGVSQKINLKNEK